MLEAISPVLNATIWAIGVTILSQVISIGVIAFLGIPPRQLPHEIEDRQNPAIGAFFLIIALIASLYIGPVSGDGYDPTGSILFDALWIIGGAALALLLTLIAFWIAHRLMDPLEGEGLYGYIKREICEEQNVSLALFLGGLAIPPFVATVYQIL